MPTILHRLAAWADSEPNSPAQTYKVNGQWKTLTAREYCDRVYWLALYLKSCGMKENDIGTIFSYNCTEWVQTDLAPLLLGAKSAGIYPNSTPKDIHFILNHTESRFLAVQNQEYFQRIVGPKGEHPLPERIQMILVFEGDPSFSTKAVSYSEAIEKGKRLAAKKGAKKLKDYLAQLDPQAPAFMIYTSGTTGNPKGALISHDNLVYTVDAVIRHWNIPKGNGSLFSFLPLCHVAEKMQNIGAGISAHFNVMYCSKFENVAKELPEANPTLLLCVPRVWEKMMEGVERKIEEGNERKKKLVRWAMGVGFRVVDLRLNGNTIGLLDRIQWIVADRLILNKIRAALGLNRAEAMASGAAALSVSVIHWFRSLGLEINEVFGQTESTGVICMTRRGEDCAGTVGGDVEGILIRIAEDGEILTQGRHVFKGYFKDEPSTVQALEGGWLHSGDLVEKNAKALIKIRGRKKEIMKTSGGKMIAPVPIEEALKAAPLISQVCMVGDGQKYLAALITLSESKLAELSKSNGVLSERMITSPQVVSEVKHYVDQLNSSLASYEQIKKFAILSKEFSILEGEMTPTLKMKRNVIESRYSDVIQHFYEHS